MTPTQPFLWGTAVSGHQVEGDNRHTDWWSFERRFTPSGEAADFRNRFPADLDIAAELGTNAFRFSLEWARVEPSPGKKDPDGIAYYDRVVEACLARGLTPLMTLVHFTLPAWCRSGPHRGWRDPAVVDAFTRHAAWVGAHFGERVPRFATVNEPAVYAAAAYLAGVFPPGRRARPDLAGQEELGLLRAHARAYHALHEAVAAHHPGCTVRVGPVQNVVAWQPSLGAFGRMTWHAASGFNWRFLDAVRDGHWRRTIGRNVHVPEAVGTADFLGLNYYTSVPADPLAMLRLVGVGPRRRGQLFSDMGWPIVPEGLESVLVAAWGRYGKPLIVTENGIADADDTRRARYIADHVSAMGRARDQGAVVDGYFYWSLLDNLEWHEGFWPRFGLIEVDYGSQGRRLRDSAREYSRVIAAFPNGPGMAPQTRS